MRRNLWLLMRVEKCWPLIHRSSWLLVMAIEPLILSDIRQPALLLVLDWPAQGLVMHLLIRDLLWLLCP